MFNLRSDTGHEAGIIVYTDNAVGVFNWAVIPCEDNSIPMLSPIGTPIAWPADVGDEAKLVHVGLVDDIREYLPGTVFAKDGQILTDMDIVYDRIDDIPALFGFGPSAKFYQDHECPYRGDIWKLPGGETVITIPDWN